MTRGREYIQDPEVSAYRAPAGTIGIIYLIHFDVPLAHAQHYLGWTVDLVARLHKHDLGSGANLLRVVNERGIGWELARIWEGTRTKERALKSGGHSQRCPLCRPIRGVPRLENPFRHEGTPPLS